MDSYRLTRKKFNRIDILWAGLFLAVFLLSLWKVRYGYVIDDEAFYATIPDRLSRGDSFFKDEWHLSQLSGFLTLPFVFLRHMAVGSNEGLLLYMRGCYLGVHTAVSALIYWKLRRLSRENENTDIRTDLIQLFSAVSSVLFSLFVPGNIMALSYNTLGVDCMALSGVFFTCGVVRMQECPTEGRPKRGLAGIAASGVFFAGAVLCCPYLAGVYFLFALSVLIFRLTAAKRGCEVPAAPLNWKTFLFFTLGAAVPAIAFLAFFLSRGSFKDIFQNLPCMLMDPEHQNTSLVYKIPRYFTAILLHGVRTWRYILPPAAVLLLAAALDKNRWKRQGVYFVLSCAAAAVCLLLTVPTLLSTDFTSMMFPLLIPASMAYILTDKKPKALFWGLFLPGLLYSLCVHLSSNQAFFVISMAVSVSDLAGVIFIGCFLSELREERFGLAPKKRLSAFCAAAASVFLLLTAGFEIYVRVNHTFRDERPSALHTELSAGPMKGVYTTEENAFLYTMAYNDLQYYSEKPEGKILMLAKEPWYYLAAYGKENASYSAWIAEEDENTLAMLDRYYTLNPEKIPDYICLSKYSQWDCAAVVRAAEEQGYTVADETDLSIKLEKEE